MAFLNSQERQNHLWNQLCLSLARNARGIGPLHPSALAAQLATPQSDRRGHDSIRRGMVGFFDNPRDDNPFGHVATYKFKGSDGIWRLGSNVSGGLVRTVPETLFTQVWGDAFQFAAVSLNGVDFDMSIPHKPHPKPKPGPTMTEMEEHVRRALQILRQEAERQDKMHHPRRRDALLHDVRILRRRHEAMLRKAERRD
jgi:hypothetical protein